MSSDFIDFEELYEEFLFLTEEGTKSNIMKGDTLYYPSGIEFVMREVPIECQNLICQSDIPESAITRGYFTVAELIVIKRLLLFRLTGEIPKIPKKSPLRLCRGIKRTYEDQQIINQNQSQQPQGGIISTKVSVIRSTNSLIGLGGVVKESMKILEENHGGSSSNQQ